MNINIAAIVKILNDNDYFYILTHQYPDGDTLGSACGLCCALQEMGKHAKVICGDEIPSKFNFLFDGIKQENFKPKYIITTDVADTALLGDNLLTYINNIDLCIDHHGSNKLYAKSWHIDSSAAATTEIIYDVIKGMGVNINVHIANCIYTGISTDTGCFKYTNATSKTYRIAADMMEAGIDAARINRVMFDTKSRARLEIERRLLEKIEFFFNSRCSVIYLTKEMIEQSKAREGDIDSLASIPRQIEGVVVGVTMREKEDGVFKISVRTDGNINASKICSKFGGGGHFAAAGCTICGGLENAKKQIVRAIGKELEE